MKNTLIGLLIIVLILAVDSFASSESAMSDKNKDGSQVSSEVALFAGGCFWCMEKPFESLTGVSSVISGYAGGSSEDPTYKNYGKGGHIEVVQIIFDPELVSYQKLLETFWRQIDPTDGGGQFIDRGHEYISAIFYYSPEQKQLAESSKNELAASGIFSKPIVTPILPAPKFWHAEDYHQDYYKKNPFRYKYYRSGSGRDTFIEKAWKGQ